MVLQVSFHKLGHGTTQTVGSVHVTPAGLGQVHATWPRHPSHKDHCGKVLLFYWVQLRVGQSARLGKLLFTVSELLKEELPQDRRGSGPAAPWQLWPCCWLCCPWAPGPSTAPGGPTQVSPHPRGCASPRYPHLLGLPLLPTESTRNSDPDRDKGSSRSLPGPPASPAGVLF